MFLKLIREIALCVQEGDNCGQKEFILPELYEPQIEWNVLTGKDNIVTYKQFYILSEGSLLFIWVFVKHQVLDIC